MTGLWTVRRNLIISRKPAQALREDADAEGTGVEAETFSGDLANASD